MTTPKTHEVAVAGLEARALVRAGLTAHNLADVNLVASEVCAEHEATQFIRNLGPLTEDERRQVKRAALAGYRVKHPDPVPALTAAARGIEKTLRAFGKALGELVPRPPQRLDVGHVFADRLYDLARDTYGREARHLSTAGSLGVTEFYGLPVVLTDRVPADVCALVDHDGTVRAVYTLGGEPARTR